MIAPLQRDDAVVRNEACRGIAITRGLAVRIRDSKSQYLVISGHRIEILRDISEYLAVSVFFKRFSDFALRALPAASSEILDISRNLGCRLVAVSPVRSQNLARFTQSPRYSDFFLKNSLVKAKSRDIEFVATMITR